MSLYEHPNQNTSDPVSLTPMHDAKELTGNAQLAHIKLDDKIYTLRITRQGKLILTK